MKIVTYNINGIRASSRVGIVDWLKSYNADVYCLQEVRCDEAQTREILYPTNAGQISLFDSTSNNNPLDKYTAIYNCGSKAGYAGTLTLTKIKPDKVLYDMGELWTDEEGRTTTIIIGKCAIINTYIPNGNSRLEFKMQYLAALTKFIAILQQKYSVICVGDYNIAHNEIDLTNPKECQNKSVFLPVERKAFDDLLALGMFDSFRELHPQDVKYSWRSYRSLQDANYNSWKYRLDYILASKSIQNKFVNSDILDVPYSDHLPAVAEIKDI